MLERIAALLFALANLAELAASLPFLRRRQVLGILSHGEAEARTFVIDMVLDAPVVTDASGEISDPAHLTVRFRALALMLCTLLARTALFGLPGATAPRAGRKRSAGWTGCRTAVPAAPDTS